MREDTSTCLLFRWWSSSILLPLPPPPHRDMHYKATIHAPYWDIKHKCSTDTQKAITLKLSPVFMPWNKTRVMIWLWRAHMVLFGFMVATVSWSHNMITQHQENTNNNDDDIKHLNKQITKGLCLQIILLLRHYNKATCQAKRWKVIVPGQRWLRGVASVIWQPTES